jgi:acetolactate synthase-1/2/3 large subunit
MQRSVPLKTNRRTTVNSDKQARQWAHGADMVVGQLEAQGVKQVFGIPGAKIDKVFDSLLDSSIEIIPVRHEANAAFMAAAVGRLTGKAGVALVTSGPGCSNLITGIATANSEGDPVVALGGAVKRADKAKLVHQSMDTVAMFSPVTKYAVEVSSRTRLPRLSQRVSCRRARQTGERVCQPAAGYCRPARHRHHFACQRPGDNGPGTRIGD